MLFPQASFAQTSHQQGTNHELIIFTSKAIVKLQSSFSLAIVTTQVRCGFCKDYKKLWGKVLSCETTGISLDQRKGIVHQLTGLSSFTCSLRLVDQASEVKIR